MRADIGAKGGFSNIGLVNFKFFLVLILSY